MREPARYVMTQMLSIFGKGLVNWIGHNHMNIILISHGLKTDVCVDLAGDKKDAYTIPKADLYIDARCLYEPQRMGVDDTDTASMERRQPSTLDRIYHLIREGLHLIPIRRRNSPPEKQNDPVVICFLCAWGKNRSVTLKHIIYNRLKRDFDVEVR